MEDNKDQIAEQTEIPVSEIASEQKKLRIKPSFVIFIPVMLVLIILAVAAWYFTLRSSEDPLLATVAKVSDTSITQKDVVEEYNKRYSAATPIASFRDIKDEARTELIDSMVERLILEKEAVKLGITVTEQEITIDVQQKILAGVPESTLTQSSTREEIRISLLKDKLREKLVTFRQIDTATIFIPEGPDMQVRFNNARTLLNEFRFDVQAGRNFAEANDIAKQKTYYNMGLVIAEKYLTKKDAEMNFLGPTAFSLKKGDVSEVVDSGGGTLGVILVKEAGDYEFGSLEEWLEAEKEKVTN